MWRKALVSLATILILAGCGAPMERITVGIKGTRLSVEVARTEEEKATGLMNRDSLPAGQGMLFVFEMDDHLTFWMKNTRIPLSIAFLSAEGRIQEIQDMEPFSLKVIRSRNSCRYALEVGKGVFSDMGAAEGDMVELPAGFR